MTAPSLLQADVILSPDPAGAVTWAEAQGLAQRPHSLALATDWLATAAAMPSTTRLYAPEDLAGGVRLNDELQLAPLTLPSAQFDASLVQGLSLFNAGRPAIGATADWPAALLEGPLGGANAGEWGTVIGPARTLAYGPFICLPPGQWRLRLAFEMDVDAARLNWSFDWGAGDSFVSLAVSPGLAGRFEAVLERAWDVPLPAQARLVLTESAMGGQVRLVSLQIERIG